MKNEHLAEDAINAAYECINANLILNLIIPIIVLITLKNSFFEWRTFIDGNFEADETNNEK